MTQKFIYGVNEREREYGKIFLIKESLLRAVQTINFSSLPLLSPLPSPPFLPFLLFFSHPHPPPPSSLVFILKFLPPTRSLHIRENVAGPPIVKGNSTERGEICTRRKSARVLRVITLFEKFVSEWNKDPLQICPPLEGSASLSQFAFPLVALKIIFRSEENKRRRGGENTVYGYRALRESNCFLCSAFRVMWKHR